MITTRYYKPSNKKRNNISFRRFTLDEKKNWTTDESGDELLFTHDKDRFIELAQAALEEAKMEEEQKGVLHELVEALLVRTGAPMMADVILEQFRSQDVIERLAEDHFTEEQKRRSIDGNNNNDYSPNILKEPTSSSASNVIEHSSSSSIDTMLLISEYLWRLFRLLLLSSLVGLVYHFMCVENQSLLCL